MLSHKCFNLLHVNTWRDGPGSIFFDPLQLKPLTVRPKFVQYIDEQRTRPNPTEPTQYQYTFRHVWCLKINPFSGINTLIFCVSHYCLICVSLNIWMFVCLFVCLSISLFLALSVSVHCSVFLSSWCINVIINAVLSTYLIQPIGERNPCSSLDTSNSNFLCRLATSGSVEWRWMFWHGVLQST